MPKAFGNLLNLANMTDFAIGLRHFIYHSDGFVKSFEMLLGLTRNMCDGWNKNKGKKTMDDSLTTK